MEEQAVKNENSTGTWGWPPVPWPSYYSTDRRIAAGMPVQAMKRRRAYQCLISISSSKSPGLGFDSILNMVLKQADKEEQPDVNTGRGGGRLLLVIQLIQRLFHDVRRFSGFNTLKGKTVISVFWYCPLAVASSLLRQTRPELAVLLRGGGVLSSCGSSAFAGIGQDRGGRPRSTWFTCDVFRVMGVVYRTGLTAQICRMEGASALKLRWRGKSSSFSWLSRYFVAIRNEP